MILSERLIDWIACLGIYSIVPNMPVSGQNFNDVNFSAVNYLSMRAEDLEFIFVDNIMRSLIQADSRQ